MEIPLDLLANHWGKLLGLWVVLSVLNTFSKHYSEYGGLKRFLLFLNEITGFGPSSNDPRLVKWPGSWKLKKEKP